MTGDSDAPRFPMAGRRGWPRQGRRLEDVTARPGQVWRGRLPAEFGEFKLADGRSLAEALGKEHFAAAGRKPGGGLLKSFGGVAGGALRAGGAAARPLAEAGGAASRPLRRGKWVSPGVHRRLSGPDRPAWASPVLGARRRDEP